MFRLKKRRKRRLFGNLFRKLRSRLPRLRRRGGSVLFPRTRPFKKSVIIPEAPKKKLFG